MPFLLSAAEVRRRKVKCRECGEEIALGAGSCPHCGFAETGGRPARWKVALALVVLIALGVSVAVWQMGLFPKRDLSVSSLGTAVADSTTIEAQRRGVSVRKRRDPPRIRSSRFQGSCLSPAPVLVYALDRTPTTYFVRLAPGTPNPRMVGDSLMIRYRLQSNGFEAQWNALFVRDVTVDVVAALRCEPAVGSIEEVSFNDSEEIRLRRLR